MFYGDLLMVVRQVLRRQVGVRRGIGRRVVSRPTVRRAPLPSIADGVFSSTESGGKVVRAPPQRFVSQEKRGVQSFSSFIPREIQFNAQGVPIREIRRAVFESYYAPGANLSSRKQSYVQQIITFDAQGFKNKVVTFGTEAKGERVRRVIKQDTKTFVQGVKVGEVNVVSPLEKKEARIRAEQQARKDFERELKSDITNAKKARLEADKILLKLRKTTNPARRKHLTKQHNKLVPIMNKRATSEGQLRALIVGKARVTDIRKLGDVKVGGFVVPLAESIAAPLRARAERIRKRQDNERKQQQVDFDTFLRTVKNQEVSRLLDMQQAKVESDFDKFKLSSESQSIRTPAFPRIKPKKTTLGKGFETVTTPFGGKIVIPPKQIIVQEKIVGGKISKFGTEVSLKEFTKTFPAIRRTQPLSVDRFRVIAFNAVMLSGHAVGRLIEGAKREPLKAAATVVILAGGGWLARVGLGALGLGVRAARLLVDTSILGGFATIKEVQEPGSVLSPAGAFVTTVEFATFSLAFKSVGVASRIVAGGLKGSVTLLEKLSLPKLKVTEKIKIKLRARKKGKVKVLKKGQKIPTTAKDVTPRTSLKLPAPKPLRLDFMIKDNIKIKIFKDGLGKIKEILVLDKQLNKIIRRRERSPVKGDIFTTLAEIRQANKVVKPDIVIRKPSQVVGTRNVIVSRLELFKLPLKFRKHIIQKISDNEFKLKLTSSQFRIFLRRTKRPSKPGDLIETLKIAQSKVKRELTKQKIVVKVKGVPTVFRTVIVSRLELFKLPRQFRKNVIQKISDNEFKLLLGEAQYKVFLRRTKRPSKPGDLLNINIMMRDASKVTNNKNVVSFFSLPPKFSNAMKIIRREAPKPPKKPDVKEVVNSDGTVLILEQPKTIIKKVAKIKLLNVALSTRFKSSQVRFTRSKVKVKVEQVSVSGVKGLPSPRGTARVSALGKLEGLFSKIFLNTAFVNPMLQPAFISLTKVSVASKVVSGVRAKVASKAAVAQRVKVAQRLASAQRLKAGQRLASAQLVNVSQLTGVKQNFKIITKTKLPPPPPFFVPPFDIPEEDDKGKRKLVSFSVRVRERALSKGVKGKLVRANRVPLTLTHALGLGAFIVDNSTARSMMITKAKGKPSPASFGGYWQNNRRKFRRPIKQGKTFSSPLIIEKVRFAIDSKGEKQQLSASRLIAKLNNQGKTGKKLKRRKKK